MEKIVSDEEAFRFCNASGSIGKVAHSMAEFKEGIETVPIECLEFHFRDDKNDFEDWLKDVMGEWRLANQIRKIKKQGLTGSVLRGALINSLR